MAKETKTNAMRMLERQKVPDQAFTYECDDFIDGIKMSGFVLNKELAEADVAEAEAKRVLEKKMAAYQVARDDYHSKNETLKKVKAKYGIK